MIRKVLKRSLILGFMILTVVAMYTSVAWAQEEASARPDYRSGGLEFSIPIFYSTSSKIDGEKGTSVDLNDAWGLGLGLGYNINANFLVGGLFTWSSRNYNATWVKDSDGTQGQYNGSMDSATLSLNGTYNILKGNITPFVTGGIGITWIDANIPSAPGETYCYWDPWLGYICGTYVPTKTETDFSCNIGAGVRWDINKDFSLKGTYDLMWTDVKEASGSMPYTNIFNLEVVFRTNITN
jgi:opacity protein-like surface antigen